MRVTTHLGPRPRLLLALVGALAGAVAGLVLGMLVGTAYEARTTLLVAHGSSLPKSSDEARQGAATVAELAESDTVAASVADSLGVPAPGIDAAPSGRSGLVVLRVRSPSAEEAVRTAQQAGLTVSQLVATRLSGARLQATIWDPAGHAEKRHPRLPLFVGLGALLGLLVGALAGSRAREAAPAAPRERPVEPRPGRYSLADLERLVDAAGLEQPRDDELRAYIHALAPEADDDGVLPASVEPIVVEVFGELLPARSTAG